MLNIDTYFYSALKAGGIDDLVGGRIYNPARTDEEDEQDIIPYIIIMPGGESVSAASKDDVCPRLDTATVQLLVVAENRENLATLAAATDDAIADAITSEDNTSAIIDSITPSAGAVELDPFKACCYQTLTYQVECSPNNN